MSETQSNGTGDRIAVIARGDLDSEGASQFLNATFDASDYPQALLDCPAPQQFINSLYDIFCHSPLDQPTRQRCVRALRKAAGKTGILPADYHISHPLTKQDAMPNAAGGCADVWKADHPDGTVFALKVFRVTQQDDFPKIKKMFCKEVLVAKQVQNENVLAIEGVQIVDAHTLCIVSEWMDNGNLLAYLKANDDASRIDLLLGVTKGLGYLHSIEVIHGDLKSPNILIDPNGNPRLTDFGLSSITRDNRSANASTPNGRGSTRWRAPELLALSTKAKGREKVKSARPTEKSDAYSLAMVVIEIFTGKHPFSSNTDEQVIVLLARDSRPERPDNKQLTSTMWTLTKKCWRKDPNKRPDISRVLKKLESGDEKKRHSLFPHSVSTFFESRLSLAFGEGSNTPR